MPTILAMTKTGIAFIIVLSILFVGGAGFLLYFFVFSRNAVKKQIRELERKYSYLDALLIGQDSQYIRRLEIISRTNLLYVDIFEQFSRCFKEIYDNDDKFAQSMIKQLNALLNNSQYKNIKSVILDARKAIEILEEKVNALDRDLYKLIKPEEDSRQSILKLKESYRRVKQIFYANSNDLDLVSGSFIRVFEKLDQLFTDFENHIESAEYEEATAIIPTIAKVVTALEDALETLPNLCILVNSIIPEKISSLSDEYYSIEKQGLPLFNLYFKHHVETWNNTLKAMKDKLTHLQTGGVLNTLEDVQNEISKVRIDLQQEVEDRKYFEANCDDFYAKVIDLEKSFLKICAILPDVEKIYIIEQNQKQRILDLKQSVSDLGSSKRVLDNYIHSATKQPYSVLKKKLLEMDEEYAIASRGISDFRVYLDSLKTSCEEAYLLVFAYYYRCKQIESTLREIGIPVLEKEYESQIDECYNLLNELDKSLKLKPIDVEFVNQTVETIKSKGNALIDDIENKYREQKLAESAIVYSNRDRNKQNEVHHQLTNLEHLFFNGDFVKVYHDANNLYRNNHVEDSNNAE